MNIEEHTDADLIKLYRAGNKSAMVILVKRWHKTFCDKAYWLVKDKNAAKDIAQDSWTIIIHKIDKLNQPYQFKYWAFKIVYNKGTDWLRLQSRKQNNEISHGIDIENTDEPYSENNKLRSVLLKAIHQLPENQKIVIKLFYIEDYSLKDISQMMNISLGTVKSRLFHAREKLKRTLKSINYEN